MAALLRRAVPAGLVRCLHPHQPAMTRPRAALFSLPSRRSAPCSRLTAPEWRWCRWDGTGVALVPFGSGLVLGQGGADGDVEAVLLDRLAQDFRLDLAEPGELAEHGQRDRLCVHVEEPAGGGPGVGGAVGRGNRG